MRNIPIWASSLFIILIAAGLLYFFLHKKPSQTSTPVTETGTTTTLGNGISITTTSGSGTISIVPVKTRTPAPSLTGAIVISAALPEDAVAVLRSDEQTLIAELTQTPNRLDLWLQLGVDRKIGGDYQGAIDAWNYVAVSGPASISYIAYGNLGDLYMNFDVNYPKAEASYKAAIATNAGIIDYYQDLYMLYRYKENNTSAAGAILSQGLKANPNNPTLLQLQAQLQSGN